MVYVGIDLGTTNSCVSLVRDGNVEIVPNAFSKDLTPSVVSIDNRGTEPQLLVGEIAKNRLVTHSDSTISRFKTFMGTKKTYDFSGRSWRPEELSATVLKSLIEDVQNTIGEEVIAGVVVSVPAYFNNSQRKAVKRAASLAGIEVCDLICEPTAAALSFGYEQKCKDETFFVLDLGGGTFDVTLIEVFNGIFEIKGSAGDNRLGGEDFTDILYKDFLRENELEEKELSKQKKTIIRSRCEMLKRELTGSDTKSFTVNLSNDYYSYELSKDKFLEITKELIKKIEAPIIRVLKDTECGFGELDKVVLVGGSTRLELFRDFVEEAFPRIETLIYNPDLSIARGAGIKAYLKGVGKKFKEYVITDVTPFSLGIPLWDEEYGKSLYTPVIERNTPLPVTKIQKCVQSKFQDTTTFVIYQGECLKPEDNHRLGEVVIEGLPYAEEVLIDCRFTLDLDGILFVEIFVPSLNIKKDLIIKNSEIEMSDSDFEECKKNLQELSIPPSEDVRYRLTFAKLDRIFEESTGEVRDEVKGFTTYLKHSLDAGEPIEEEKAILKVNEFLSRFSFE